MKEENNKFDIPFQVQQLLSAVNDKSETPHVRSNYRMRLDSIRREVDKAIYNYDVEMGNVHSLSFPKGKR